MIQPKPWHIPFSLVGGANVTVQQIEPDRVVICDGERYPLLIDLTNGDCIDVVPDYMGHYVECKSPGRVFG